MSVCSEETLKLDPHLASQCSRKHLLINYHDWHSSRFDYEIVVPLDPFNAPNKLNYHYLILFAICFQQITITNLSGWSQITNLAAKFTSQHAQIDF